MWSVLGVYLPGVGAGVGAGVGVRDMNGRKFEKYRVLVIIDYLGRVTGSPFPCVCACVCAYAFP